MVAQAPARGSKARSATLSGGARFAIAVASGAVLLGLLAWGIEARYHPVRPRILCVMPLGTGGMAVHFGFTNTEAEAVDVPFGEDNAILPASAGGAERRPTHFAPGSSGAYPDSAFVVTAKKGEGVAWKVGPRTVAVDDETPSCLVPKLVKPEDVALVLPKVEVVKPPEPEVKPPEPEVVKPPEPVVVEAPKPAPDRATPKKPKPEGPKKPPEPVALALAGLGTVQGGGMAILSGEIDSLGDPSITKKPVEDVAVPRRDDGVGGTGVGIAEIREVKRVAARVKVRPRGEWPADAPPRAGAVIVRLSLLVGTDGRVKQAKVVRGAGPAFDREAKEVGMRAVFEPATLDGVAVESWVPWDVEFTPDGF